MIGNFLLGGWFVYLSWYLWNKLPHSIFNLGLVSLPILIIGIYLLKEVLVTTDITGGRHYPFENTYYWIVDKFKHKKVKRKVRE